MPPLWKEATISLILKAQKDPKECESYKPISLLNSAFSKILANRLSKVGGEVIHQDQRGFLPKRHLHELTNDLIGASDLAVAHKIPLAILALDATKPFDRVNWQYLSVVWKIITQGQSLQSHPGDIH